MKHLDHVKETHYLASSSCFIFELFKCKQNCSTKCLEKLVFPECLFKIQDSVSKL